MKHHSRNPSKSGRQTRRRSASAPATARRQYEHFLALARAEDSNGDRVAAENYYQHAEHYYRVGSGSGHPLSVEA